MKILAEITEASLGIEPAVETLGRNYKLRKSARGIILNEGSEVSLQHVTKKAFYKLPGGGIDPGETIEQALRREILEEVGCNIANIEELGATIEYRNPDDLLHISYGFIARVDGEVGEPAYEQGELDDGFVPVWIPLEEAVALVRGNPGVDEPLIKFMVEREATFLEEALRVLNDRLKV